MAPSQPALPFDAPTYLFTRHPKARRYLIRVREDGSVRVTIPRWGSRRDAEAFAAQERAWIDRQLRRLEQARAARPRRTLPPGEREALLARAKQELPVRLRGLADRHGLAVTRVSIRNQRWRWGSCSRDGHICLNWRLVLMPPDVADYVMIHELMHLRRMDHSPKFWRLVAQACPEYRACRAWLREHADLL